MNYSSFSQFPLVSSLLAALERLEYAIPTPIQAAAIAPQLAGRDVVGIAITGSGKTAAYGLPLLHALIAQPGRAAPRTCRALVLAPTRELACQIVSSLRGFGRGAGLSACLVVGGVPRNKQIARLSVGVDIVVATPGRLTDLMRARALGLEATRHIVVDEADRMLDLGFLGSVRRILARAAPDRQTVMFSATMPPAVVDLAAQLMRDPLQVEAPALAETRPHVTASAELVGVRRKVARLLEIVRGPDVTSAIVFCRTRRGADWVQRTLEREGVVAGVIHSDRRQEERARTLARFRRGRLAVLVATDIVARGIDVPDISHVINFDLPDCVDTYVHRIGRTGRAGAPGTALTFCTPHEIGKIRWIERETGQRLLPSMRATCRPPATGRGLASCQAPRCSLVRPGDRAISLPPPPGEPRAPAIPPPPPPAVHGDRRARL